MEFIGELVGAAKDITSGRYNITFRTDTLPVSVNDTKGVLKIKAVKNRKKRSLDANAYAWLLMSQIAEKLGSSKEEVYEQMLVRYGYPAMDKNDAPYAVTVPATVHLGDVGLHVRFIGTHYANNNMFSSYIILRGSSEYDTKEMATFIDGVVSDAEELGIDTVPKVELDKIKEKWRI